MANLTNINVYSQSNWGNISTTNDTDLNFVETPAIVETYKNGNAWYRIYSDGWCIQGDVINGGVSSCTVNLLKPYNSTEYLLYTTARGSDNDTGGYADYPCAVNGGSPYTNGQSTTGFRLSTTTGTNKIDWIAFGYIA